MRELVLLAFLTDYCSSGGSEHRVDTVIEESGGAFSCSEPGASGAEDVAPTVVVRVDDHLPALPGSTPPALSPSTARHRHRRDWRPVFLEHFRNSGNVREAAEAVGVDRSTPYRTAERDPAFAAKWAAAGEDAADVLEFEARRRALAGSDALLMSLLRAFRPDRYGETRNVHVEVRREAVRVAAKLGLPVEEVLEAAEARARELVG
jgi:hypothetical protein